jgi:hypothetical protein
MQVEEQARIKIIQIWGRFIQKSMNWSINSLRIATSKYYHDLYVV